MRLVSAIYGEEHPFGSWKIFTDVVTTSDPDILTGGDVLVVWGGGDISPSLYNKPLSMFGGGSETPGRRDAIEWALMHRAKTIGVPIIGVCRGGQMLTALAGGTLIQHVTKHGSFQGHDVTTLDGKTFKVNSIHHQMMVPPTNGTPYQIVARSSERLSDCYWDVVDGQDTNIDIDVEPESIYYPDIKGFAIQWHPEAMAHNSEATLYLHNFIVPKL